MVWTSPVWAVMGLRLRAYPSPCWRGWVWSGRGFLPACPPPPCRRPASPSSALGRKGLCARGGAKDETPTPLPRAAVFPSWISPMRPTNKTSPRALFHEAATKFNFAGDLSPLSERKGSMLTNRQ